MHWSRRTPRTSAAAAKSALGAFHDWRHAEAEGELTGIRDAYGEPEPTVGTVVIDSPTLERPPGFTNVNSAFITMPDGRVLDEDELLSHRRPPQPPEGSLQ